MSVIGGEGSAVTDWAEQEMIEGRRELTLWEGRRGLQGKRVARGEKMVACMTARGGKGLKKGFLAAQCVWRRHFKQQQTKTFPFTNLPLSILLSSGYCVIDMQEQHQMIAQ